MRIKLRLTTKTIDQVSDFHPGGPLFSLPVLVRHAERMECGCFQSHPAIKRYAAKICDFIRSEKKIIREALPVGFLDSLTAT